MLLAALRDNVPVSAADNLQVVEGLYAALDADDIPAFLDLCAAEAILQYPADGVLPYGGVWRGREGIERWTELHDQAEEILDFEVGDMVPRDDMVLVLGFFRGRAKDTGRTWETRFIHALTIRDDRLQRWEAYFDSAVAVEAHRT